MIIGVKFRPGRILRCFLAILSLSIRTQGIFVTAENEDCITVNKIPDEFEPSGLTYDPSRDRLYVVDDNGQIAYYNSSMYLVESFDSGLDDVEGVTFAENDYTKLYLAHEYPSTIFEFDLDARTLTGRYWNLTDFPGNEEAGFEALTWVLMGYSIDDTPFGLFYAGNQFDGRIYLYDIDLSISGDQEVAPSAGIDLGWLEDCSGLNYDDETGYVQAISDHYDELVVFEKIWTSGSFQWFYVHVIYRSPLPDDNQEGIATRINKQGVQQMFISNDDGKGSPNTTIHIFKYPITEECGGSSLPPSVSPHNYDDDDDDDFRRSTSIQVTWMIISFVVIVSCCSCAICMSRACQCCKVCLEQSLGCKGECAGNQIAT